MTKEDKIARRKAVKNKQLTKTLWDMANDSGNSNKQVRKQANKNRF